MTTEINRDMITPLFLLLYAHIQKHADNLPCASYPAAFPGIIPVKSLAADYSGKAHNDAAARYSTLLMKIIQYHFCNVKKIFVGLGF